MSNVIPEKPLWKQNQVYIICTNGQKRQRGRKNTSLQETLATKKSRNFIARKQQLSDQGKKLTLLQEELRMADMKMDVGLYS
jgi:hypothetical protein